MFVGDSDMQQLQTSTARLWISPKSPELVKTDRQARASASDAGGLGWGPSVHIFNQAPWSPEAAGWASSCFEDHASTMPSTRGEDLCSQPTLHCTLQVVRKPGEGLLVSPAFRPIPYRSHKEMLNATHFMPAILPGCLNNSKKWSSSETTDS